METTQAKEIRAGIRIEIITIVWMVIEMSVSIGAGIVAGSVLLTAFGLDSLIELVSGTVLLWRLRLEGHGSDVESVQRAEHKSAWIVAILLVILCLYVLVSSVFGLITHAKPESSVLGLSVAAAAVVVMPYIAVMKRRAAIRISSNALAGDAVNSFTCAYMAGTVLMGLALNSLFGLWWADSVAALVFLTWLIRETREALEEAAMPQHDHGGHTS